MGEQEHKINKRCAGALHTAPCTWHILTLCLVCGVATLLATGSSAVTRQALTGTLRRLRLGTTGLESQNQYSFLIDPRDGSDQIVRMLTSLSGTLTVSKQ